MKFGKVALGLAIIILGYIALDYYRFAEYESKRMDDSREMQYRYLIKTFEENDTIYSCQNDFDCTRLNLECGVAINKEHLEYWKSKFDPFKEIGSGGSCDAMVRKPYCIEGKCQMSGAIKKEDLYN